ncbi:MAG: hypothetical protein QGH98_10995 [Nitrospinaceae bacterium]|jgi:hypothetical protein|nr:hypothetical protein [Nitrospinaceae bacterium]
MSLCKNCSHGCHHSDSGKCASCSCANCEHDIQEALNKLLEMTKPVKTVEFEPEMDLDSTENKEEK